MAKLQQTGFTLVEVVLFLAISSLLLVGVVAGQANLRSRAEFDADIDKVVASIAYTQNEAVSGTNLSGNGQGTSDCPGGGGQSYFAGTVWEADNALSGSPIMMKYYRANPGNGAGGKAACLIQTKPGSPAKQSISLPYVGVTLSATTPSFQGIVYARTQTGGLVVCYVTNASDASPQVLMTFETGACVGGAKQIAPNSHILATFKDAQGHSSNIEIDSSGLAKRVN